MGKTFRISEVLRVLPLDFRVVRGEQMENVCRLLLIKRA